LTGFQVAAGGLQCQITSAAPHSAPGCSFGQALEDGCGFLVLSRFEQALSAAQQL